MPGLITKRRPPTTKSAKKDWENDKNETVAGYLTERGNIKQANIELNSSKLEMERQLQAKEKKLSENEKDVAGRNRSDDRKI